MEASGSTYPPKDKITVEFVKSLKKPTGKMLCQLKDNDLIRFGQYRIRDIGSGMVLLHISSE